MSGARIVSRRRALSLAGAFCCAVLMSGCSKDPYEFDDATHARMGYRDDTEVKDYPVTLRLYVDENVSRMGRRSGYAGEARDEGADLLSHFISLYQNEPDRSNVDFDIVYTAPADLRFMASDGFPDGDGVIALHSVIEEGTDAGTIDGGEGGFMIRSLSMQFGDFCRLVKMKGSGVELPPSRTLTGEDAVDGSYTQLDELAKFDGVIGLADPATCTEGVAALRILAERGLYTGPEYGGGQFAEDVEDKLRIYQDVPATLQALKEGECQMIFAFDSYSDEVGWEDVRLAYSPANLKKVGYSGAALTNAPEPGVARDFLTFVAQKGAW